MNSLDLYLLIPIVAGAVIGLFRGFIKEIISLIIIFAGIYLARAVNAPTAEWLSGITDISLKIAKPIAFILIFIATAIILSLLGHLIGKMISMLSLGFLNAIAGFIFGGLKFILIVSIVVNLIAALDTKLSLIDSEAKSKSALYEPVKNFGPELWRGITDKNE